MKRYKKVEIIIVADLLVEDEQDLKEKVQTMVHKMPQEGVKNKTFYWKIIGGR